MSAFTISAAAARVTAAPAFANKASKVRPRAPRRADATRVARRVAGAVESNVDGAALTPKDRRRRASPRATRVARAMTAAMRARDGKKYARRVRGASGARRAAWRRDDGNPTTDPASRFAHTADVRSPDRGEAHVRRPRVGEDGCDHRRDEDAHGECGARDRARTRRGRRDDDDATPDDPTR